MIALRPWDCAVLDTLVACYQSMRAVGIYMGFKAHPMFRKRTAEINGVPAGNKLVCPGGKQKTGRCFSVNIL